MKKKSNAKRKDITLMTLIANESTSDARKLLKKYGKQDAANYEDLETKLANLYFEQNDKITLEKELAEIHPHKKWLSKYIAPPIEIKKEEVTIEVKPEEKKSNADGCECPMCMRNRYASFSGDSANQKNNVTDYIGIIGMVAVVGVLFMIVSKNK